MNNGNTDQESKIDFEELISQYRIKDKELFSSYLTEIWLDLRIRSDKKDLGINKFTFFNVYNIN